MDASSSRASPFFPSGKSIREFTLEEIGDWLSFRVPTLREIASGEKDSRRHEVYSNGPPRKRAAMVWQTASIKIVTTEQQEFIAKELLKIFSPNDTKRFTYTMDVLIPEAVIYLTMDAYAVDYHKAEELMFLGEAEDADRATDEDIPDPTELVERANRMQKEMRHTHGTTKSSNTTRKRKHESSGTGTTVFTSVSVCMMKVTPKGLYKSASNYMECRAQKTDTYSDIVERMAGLFGLADEDGRTLSLFKPRGAIIPAEELEIGGESVMWTLGGYFRLMHQSPENVKFGVGYIDDPQETTKRLPVQRNKSRGRRSADDEVDHHLQRIEVSYALFDEDEQQFIFRGSREDVLQRARVLSTNPATFAEHSFHPEDHGFVVDSITVDGVPVFRAGAAAAAASSVDGGIQITHQSPGRVDIPDLKSVYPLYCVVYPHTLDCKYKWSVVPHTSDELPCSPVIYTRKPGIYHCEVTFASDGACSKMIDLRLLPRTSQMGGEPSGSLRSTSPSTAVAESAPSSLQAPNMEFKYEELLAATENCSSQSLIGSGGYGSVYLGTLRHTKVAIKFLNVEGERAVSKGQAETQMKSEIGALTKFRHPNLVPLMGYSIHPPALVMELQERGSLYHNIHETENPLIWDERGKVLHDTCRGLVYLHSATPPLVHQDIKSLNILIDINGSGKIGDFGFSLELPTVECGRSMFTAQNFARTEGYYPSELTHGKYSAKSDVYSYGIVALETFTGLPAYSRHRDDPKLAEHCHDELQNADKFTEIADRRISLCPQGLTNTLFQVINTSLLRHSKRPTSAKVLELWEKEGSS